MKEKEYHDDVERFLDNEEDIRQAIQHGVNLNTLNKIDDWVLAHDYIPRLNLLLYQSKDLNLHLADAQFIEEERSRRARYWNGQIHANFHFPGTVSDHLKDGSYEMNSFVKGHFHRKGHFFDG